MATKTTDDVKAPDKPDSTEPQKPATSTLDDMTPDQLRDYVKELRSENAAKRISDKALKEEITSLKSALQEKDSTFSKAEEELTLLRKEKQAREDAEKTESQKLIDRISALEKGFAEKDSAIEDLKGKLSAKDLQIAQKDRESTLDRLALTLGYEWSSEYEREGLLSKLCKSQNGKMLLSDEEAMKEVNDFVKKRTTTPKVPPTGPNNRTTEQPLAEEVKALLLKQKTGKITPDDRNRLNELLEEMDKRSTELEPRRGVADLV